MSFLSIRKASQLLSMQDLRFRVRASGVEGRLLQDVGAADEP